MLFAFTASAQYAPPAGQPGSSAVHADSSVFIDWAVSAVIERGWMNVADTMLGKAKYGDSASAVGRADNNVVSLGDGGWAIVFFDKPVTNGNGADFAVFENGFNDTFLELAFVEVSSDGENFFRFPAVSLTQTTQQVETFGTLEAEKIHNLAGKYRVFYGVPFDLETLKNEQGLDVNHIIAIKIRDVTGSIDDTYCTFDSEGNKINDPWPTPFESGGFDLDAVGVIHNTSNTYVLNESGNCEINLYPNPCNGTVNISGAVTMVKIYSLHGQLLRVVNVTNRKKMDLTDLPEGMLIINAEGNDGVNRIFKIINR